jgi:hypothetical protein
MDQEISIFLLDKRQYAGSFSGTGPFRGRTEFPLMSVRASICSLFVARGGCGFSSEDAGPLDGERGLEGYSFGVEDRGRGAVVPSMKFNSCCGQKEITNCTA